MEASQQYNIMTVLSQEAMPTMIENSHCHLERGSAVSVRQREHWFKAAKDSLILIFSSGTGAKVSL